MPQTTTIETVTLKRPLKFIALICGMCVVVLMIMGLMSTDWLMAEGFRQGLFSHCIAEGARTPLPFNIVDPPGCYSVRNVGYIKAAAILCVVCLIADIAATILTGLGLRTQDHYKKNNYYRLGVFCMGGALVVLLIALVIYPVCFTAELNFGNRPMWEFGWAYGVGWGAAIFLFGGAMLLLCDKESEEIYYKERKIVREDVATGMIGSGNNSIGANHPMMNSSSAMSGPGGAPALHHHHHNHQSHHHPGGASAGGPVRSGTQLA
ncbi:transmembrane protein 47 isoform X2 [Copidosoma floridanum]|uniref:transmembrane protein 47 isoform X2 n=1 Tax=Copidosoma floridanum TaxID=29053 RepID=UPI0006C9A12E|nr:transmembrane protein 47 isoform X2 [Copidosoma floridanum]